MNLRFERRRDEAAFAAAFRRQYGPWALVAGASEGLGAEWARQLADLGLNLVLVADDAPGLGSTAERIKRRTGVEVRAIVVDLAVPDFLPKLEPALEGIAVHLLVYNAAFVELGEFASQPAPAHLRTLDVNCRAPLLLCSHFAPEMARAGRGGIVLMSSLAGLVGSPLAASYAATKAFNLVLGESLWDELRPHGVDVLAWCPGATDTPGYRKRQPKEAALAPAVMAPPDVVSEAIGALGRKPSGIAGRANRVASFLLHRLRSRRAAVETTGRAMRARFPR